MSDEEQSVEQSPQIHNHRRALLTRVLPITLVTLSFVFLAYWMTRPAEVHESLVSAPTLDEADFQDSNAEGQGMLNASEDTEETLQTGETESSNTTQTLSIDDLLFIAQQTYDKMKTSLKDYSATFIQQEQDTSGVLGPVGQMKVKIQTRVRNETNDAPMRVYLKFELPKETTGREVIWGKDLYEGKLAAHETSAFLSWKTFYLDPEGMLAMRGQKYPIWEIGLVRLAEQLLERGEKMKGDPAISVRRFDNVDGDESKNKSLFRIQRSSPSGQEDDFSVAEVIIDFDRSLVLVYRSFGWPTSPDDEPPLIESYEYKDIQLNSGLSPLDFDVANEAYAFPE